MTGEQSHMTSSAETELAHEAVTMTYIGTLADFNLGSGNIRSNASAEHVEELTESFKECFSPVEDDAHRSCIDGRRVERNADGSLARVQLHQPGGRLATKVGAVLAGSVWLDTLRSEGANALLYELGDVLEERYNLKPSSHTGGCGAAVRLPEHLEKTNTPEIANAVEGVLGQLGSYLGVSYNKEHMSEIADAADQFKEALIADNWDGSEYTDVALSKDASGVEELVTQHDETHGHHEQLVMLVASDEAVTIDEAKLAQRNLPDTFVSDLLAIKKDADFFAGMQGQEARSKYVHARIALLLSVASNLCASNMHVVVARVQ